MLLKIKLKKLELNVNLILSCRLIGRISDIRDGTDVMQIFDLVTLTHNICRSKRIQSNTTFYWGAVSYNGYSIGSVINLVTKRCQLFPLFSTCWLASEPEIPPAVYLANQMIELWRQCNQQQGPIEPGIWVLSDKSFNLFFINLFLSAAVICSFVSFCVCLLFFCVLLSLSVFHDLEEKSGKKLP